VTVVLVSHRSYVTDIVICPLMSSAATEPISRHITKSVTYNLCYTRITVTFPATAHQTNLDLYALTQSFFSLSQTPDT